MASYSLVLVSAKIFFQLLLFELALYINLRWQFFYPATMYGASTSHIETTPYNQYSLVQLKNICRNQVYIVSVCEQAVVTIYLTMPTLYA